MLVLARWERWELPRGGAGVGRTAGWGVSARVGEKPHRRGELPAHASRLAIDVFVRTIKKCSKKQKMSVFFAPGDENRADDESQSGL